MKYSCDIIRDLLPLYCDGVCSNASAEAVQEHLRDCGACRDLYSGMKQGIAVNSAEYEKQQTASMQGIKKKLKKRNTAFATVGLIAGILLVSIIIRILLVAGVIVFAEREGWKNSYTSTDITEYGTFEGFKGYSKLDVFPDQLDDSMEVLDYSYYYAETFLDPTAQIYLECKFEEDAYLKEIERLKAIQEEYQGEIQAIRYDADSFPFPAYVTIDAHNHCYEYALLLGENRIAYIYLQFIKEDRISFPAEYLPKDYEQRHAGYSIYIFRQKNGDGYGVF